jgi:nucleotide-binding universal stress UspA family protein
MQLRKILVAVDYSEHSKSALAYAAMLAEHFGSKIEVLHVWDPPPYVSPGGKLTSSAGGHVSVPELIRENAEREMQEFLDGCELPDSVRVTHHLIGGEPTKKILDTVKQGFQLLVLGTHGHSGFRHLLLGSVAERIVQLSPVPVLTVPAARGS